MKAFYAITLILAGCASAPVFEMRAGATDDEFEREDAQCMVQATSVSSPAPGQGRFIYVNCMRGKGWKLAPKR